MLLSAKRPNLAGRSNIRTPLILTPVPEVGQLEASHQPLCSSLVRGILFFPPAILMTMPNLVSSLVYPLLIACSGDFCCVNTQIERRFIGWCCTLFIATFVRPNFVHYYGSHDRYTAEIWSCDELQIPCFLGMPLAGGLWPHRTQEWIRKKKRAIS